jgi:hypothetical protein
LYPHGSSQGLYARLGKYVEHAAGGLGPWIVLIVLVLLVVVPLVSREKKQAPRIGAVQAARNGSPILGICFVIILALAAYFALHP